MKWLAALLSVFRFVGATGFRVGDGTLTAADSAGAPHHFTIGEAIAAYLEVKSGTVGSFQIGSITFTYSPILPTSA